PEPGQGLDRLVDQLAPWSEEEDPVSAPGLAPDQLGRDDGLTRARRQHQDRRALALGPGELHQVEGTGLIGAQLRPGVGPGRRRRIEYGLRHGIRRTLR